MKKRFFLIGCMALFGLASCGNESPEAPSSGDGGSYNFVIYAPDSNNDDLSDNPVVASYEVTYTSTQNYVLDTLVSKDGKYFITEEATDYIVFAGGFATVGYFANYASCANDTAIDVSWSKTFENGVLCSTGADGVSLNGLTEYSFVIDGWR